VDVAPAAPTMLPETTIIVIATTKSREMMRVVRLPDVRWLLCEGCSSDIVGDVDFP
jgi:hypothetical protein